jgi:hypothetical protein
MIIEYWSLIIGEPLSAEAPTGKKGVVAALQARHHPRATFSAARSRMPSRLDQHTSQGMARLGDRTEGDMNSEIQGTGTLLTELLEAYRDLPHHVQGQVKHVLRESSEHQQTCEEGEA